MIWAVYTDMVSSLLPLFCAFTSSSILPY